MWRDDPIPAVHVFAGQTRTGELESKARTHTFLSGLRVLAGDSPIGRSRLNWTIASPFIALIRSEMSGDRAG